MNLLRLGCLLALSASASCDRGETSIDVGPPLPPFSYRDVEGLDPQALARMRATIVWLAADDESNPPDYLGGTIPGGESAARHYLHNLGRPAMHAALVRFQEDHLRGRCPEALVVFLGLSSDPWAAPSLVKALVDNLKKAGLASLHPGPSSDLAQYRAIHLLKSALSDLGVNALPYLVECLQSKDPLVSGIALELAEGSVRIQGVFAEFGWKFPTGEPDARRAQMVEWWKKNAHPLGWRPELQRFLNPSWYRPQH